MTDSPQQRVLAHARALQAFAAEQLAKAEQASDPQSRQMYMAAAKAYANWATEIEKVAGTIESIEGTRTRDV